MNPGIFTISEHVVITFMASFLIWIMFAGVIALWFFDGKFKWRHVFFVFLASFVAWSVSEIIKQIFPTLRPFEVGGMAPLTITIPTDASFPSGHTSTAFALAVSLRKFSRKAYVIYIIFAILVALGRVLSHVHYYIDVIVGAGIGIFSVYLLDKVSKSKLLKMKLF